MCERQPELSTMVALALTLTLNLTLTLARALTLTAGQDRYYDHPATALFPDFEAWFAFLQAHGLKTYFNDREWAATRTGGHPNRRDHPLTLTGGAGPNPLAGGRWVASG